MFSSQSAEITWSPPDGELPNLRYKLLYRKLDRPDDLETQSVVAKPQYTLHGLDKDTRYAVRVHALVADGNVGPTGEEVEFRTLTDVPDAPPVSLRAEPVSPTSVKVCFMVTMRLLRRLIPPEIATLISGRAFD